MGLRDLMGLYRVIAVIALAALPVQGSEIFSDDFESGGVRAWTRIVGVDCEMMMSQVPDCDFDQGLSGWIGSPPAHVYAVIDDSDGDETSGAVQMVVDPQSGGSMTLCFPKTVSGQAFLTGFVDVKVVGGDVSVCRAEKTKFTSTDCSGQHSGWSRSSFWPGLSSWKPHWLGGGLAYENIQSLRLTLICDGDAIVRFDDVIMTPLKIHIPG